MRDGDHLTKLPQSPSTSTNPNDNREAKWITRIKPKLNPLFEIDGLLWKRLLTASRNSLLRCGISSPYFIPLLEARGANGHLDDVLEKIKGMQDLVT